MVWGCFVCPLFGFGQAGMESSVCDLGSLAASALEVCKGDTVYLTATTFPPCVPPAAAAWGGAPFAADSGAASVAVDAEGNHFLAGTFSGTLAWSGGSWTAVGATDAFLAKFTSCGEPAWVVVATSAQGGEQSGTSGSALATTPDGALYWVGRHIGALAVKGTGGTAFTATGISSMSPTHQDGFLVKVSETGGILWGATLTGASGEGWDGVAVMPDGGPVVFGEFNACCESSGFAEIRGPGWTRLLQQSNSDYLRTAVLLRMGPQGTYGWTNTVSNRETAIHAVAVAGSGEIYAALSFRSWNQFPNVAGPVSLYRDAAGAITSIANPGFAGSFLVKVGSNGNLLWNRGMGNAGTLGGIQTFATALILDAEERPVVAGHFRALPFSLAGTTVSLPATAAFQGFAARWQSSGNALDAVAFAPNTNDLLVSHATPRPGGGWAFVGRHRAAAGDFDAVLGEFAAFGAAPVWTWGSSAGHDRWASVASVASGVVVGGGASTAFIAPSGASIGAGTHYVFSVPPVPVPVELVWTTGASALQGSGENRFAVLDSTATFGAAFTAGTATCAVSLTVSALPVDSTFLSVLLPEGETYAFAGGTYAAPDTVVFVAANAFGCDSVVTLVLEVEPPCFGLVPGCTDAEACNFDAAANCDDGTCIPAGCMDPLACNFEPAAGCPSGVCLFYTAFAEPAAVCAGDSALLTVTASAAGGASTAVSWSNGITGPVRTVVPAQSTSYGFVVSSGVELCAGVLPVSVYPVSSVALTVSLQPGETYTLNGVTSGAPGFLSATFTSSVGCDSTVVVQLLPADPCLAPGAVPGCTDASACNFLPSANCDDGSCTDVCCPGPGCCAQGTEWSYALEQCVVAVDLCGPGTFWNSALGVCMPVSSCLGDFNGDLEVDTSDLMDFLLLFGTTCGNFPGGGFSAGEEGLEE